MAKLAAVKVKDGKTDEAIIDFLKSLIEKGVVEDLILPKALPSGEGVVQTLIRDPVCSVAGAPSHPRCPCQSARVVSNLSIKNLGKKVGAVMKSCEIRAIVELAKFLQVKLDNLYLIGIDCPGTFEVPDYAKMVQEGKGGEKLTQELFRGMEKGESAPPADYVFRTACQMCEYPVPQADIVLKLYGYPTDREIGIEVGKNWRRRSKRKGSCPFRAKIRPTEPGLSARSSVKERRSGMPSSRNSREWSRAFPLFWTGLQRVSVATIAWWRVPSAIARNVSSGRRSLNMREINS